MFRMTRPVWFLATYMHFGKFQGAGAWSGTRNLIRYSCRSSPWISKQLLAFFLFWVWVRPQGRSKRTRCVIVEPTVWLCKTTVWYVFVLFLEDLRTFTTVHSCLLRKSPASCMKAFVCVVMPKWLLRVACADCGDTKRTLWDTNCHVYPVSWWILRYRPMATWSRWPNGVSCLGWSWLEISIGCAFLKLFPYCDIMKICHVMLTLLTYVYSYTVIQLYIC